MQKNAFKKILDVLFLVTFLLIFFLACEHSQLLAPNQQQATLSNIQARIFSQKCGVAGCHVPRGNGPMSLQNTNESFASLVGVPSVEITALNRVQPNDPDNSYLVQKVEGAPGISGQRMPLGGPPLSSSEIALIREWIANGAGNN